MKPAHLFQLHLFLSFSIPFDAIGTSKINTVDWQIGDVSLWKRCEIFEIVKERDGEKGSDFRNKNVARDSFPCLSQRQTVDHEKRRVWSHTSIPFDILVCPSPRVFTGTHKSRVRCSGALHVSQTLRSTCVRSPGINCTKNESNTWKRRNVSRRNLRFARIGI